MKDRIGGTTKKKNNSDSKGSFDTSGVTLGNKPSGDGNKKTIIIVCVVVLLILLIVGGFFFLKKGKVKVPSATKPDTIEYPFNTGEIPQEEQDEHSLLFKTKAIKIPSIRQLTDIFAINDLIGPVEIENDGVNAKIIAELPTDSLATKAADFKVSTNSDTIGWVQLPNTNIDYPVVYKEGKENYDYYNHLDYNKAYSKDGVIWADYEASFPNLSQNTTMYGHNWHNIYKPRTLANAQNNDLMFSLLASYHYTDFAQKNPFIYFSTTEEDSVWQVFAAFYTDLNFTYSFANMNPELFHKTIAEAKAKSLQDYSVPVTSEDKIITLSTCTRLYGNTENQRFVVMAKKVNPGTPSTTISTHKNHMALGSSVKVSAK